MEQLFGIIPSEEINTEEAKTVFSVALARFLIKSRKHVLIDIKPDKYSASREKSLYVFLKTPELLEDINKYRQQRKQNGGE